MAKERKLLLQNTLRWGFTLGVGVIAFYAAQPYGAMAPLGAALPDVPELIQYEGVEFKDSSFLAGKLSSRLLELMAPQADGLPPLHSRYVSKSTGFSIGQPYGTAMTVFLRGDFMKDDVLCQSLLRDDLPLKAIKFSLPSIKDDEKVTVYVSRMRDDLERKGAVFLSSQGVLELTDYRFESLAYEREDDSGDTRTHFLFFGPFGKRCLVIDFVGLEGQYLEAKPLVEKIIRSFEPGELILGLLEEGEQGVLVSTAGIDELSDGETDE